MMLLAPVNYAPHCPLVKIMGDAELRKVNSFNKRTIGRKNSKGALLSLGHCSLFNVTHWLAGVWVVVPRPPVSVFKPALSGTVAHIVGLCSKEKVVGPNAFFIVAFVANVQRFIKGAVSYLIGRSMSRNAPTMPNTHDAITGRHKAANPNPAFVSFANFAEKPIYKSLCNHEYTNTKNYKECQ